MPISNGMKNASIATASSALSKNCSTLTVRVNAIASMSSQGARLRASWNTVAVRYGRSSGSAPPAREKSSVSSASRTSIASSTVIMPTSRSSRSTTGRATRLASWISRAAFS